MIQFESVSKKFERASKETLALSDVNLTIQSQECFGVIGESGAGKSTLLRMINALEYPTSGHVLVDGVKVGDLAGKQLQRHRSEIGMVFQQFNLLNNKTIQENITLPLELHKHQEVLEVDHVLDFVGLTDKRDAYPAELSGGQKQRVGIARALITKPKILLCDEPTSALDQLTTDEIVQLLKRANQEFEMTILVVTHELEVVKQLCDRSAVMEEGKVVSILDVKKRDNPYQDMDYKTRASEVLQAWLPY